MDTTYANILFNRLIPVMVRTGRAFVVECRSLFFIGAQFRIIETFADGTSSVYRGWMSTGKASAFVYALRMEHGVPANETGY